MLIGDVGGGHRAPAQAIKQVFDQQYAGQYEVDIVDLFTEADIAPYNTSEASYALFSQNYTLEKINNLVYRLINTRLGSWFFTKYTLSRLYYPTLEIIRNSNPDILVSNNPIVCLVASSIKKKEGGFYSVTQITDLGKLLRGWADKSADLIVSPSKQAIDELIRYGIDKSKIVGPLFPIRKGFSDPSRPRGEFLSSLGLNSKGPVVLVTGGGVGTNKYMLKAIDSIASDSSLQIIIMAGKVDKVRRSLEHRYQMLSNLKVVGFVNNMQDYYNAADIIVAKPGTSTVLETELLRKKTIFTRKVGEQEIGNVRYLKRNPLTRYLGDDWKQLGDYIHELLHSEDESNSQRSFDESYRIVAAITEGYSKYAASQQQNS